MTKFNAEFASLHTVGAPVEPEQPTVHIAYVGLDVHKDASAYFAQTELDRRGK
ncbi:MAG: hypothetical protein ACQEW0_14770 [Pseudomonadota bacterium]